MAAPDFEATIAWDGDRAIVALSGECDVTVRHEFAAVLAEAVSSSQVVVVDLSGLAFLDSSGINELVSAYRTARDARVGLYARNATGMVATVLEVTGVGELLSQRAAPEASAGEDPR
jgi:anti-sigma B factor antagonist